MFKISVVALIFAPLVVGQVDQLKTECHVLQTAETLINQLATKVVTLDALQTRLTSAEARIDQQTATVATLRQSLTDVETEIANLKTPQITQTPQTTETSRTDCLAGWVEFQGSCYFSISGGYSFEDAQVKCQELGARLIHIETEAENTFIKNYLATLSTGDIHWIGLDDIDVEGVWKWTGTGSVATYTDWYPGEPNNHGSIENCAHMGNHSNLNGMTDHAQTHIDLCVSAKLMANEK